MDASNQGQGFDTSRWSADQKDAIAEAFTQVQRDLHAELQQKLDPSASKQAGGLIEAYFGQRIEQLKTTTAGASG